MRRSGLFLGLLFAVALPNVAQAQYVSHARGPVWDRFSLEPYAGRFYDNAGIAPTALPSSGSASGFNAHGWIGGARLGVAVLDRVRLVGDVGYSRVDNIAQIETDLARASYGSESWLLAGGVELDVVPGDTRGSLSLLGGRAWRDVREHVFTGQTGVLPTPATDSPVNMVVPGVSIAQRIAPRGDLKLSVQNYMFVGADPVSHNWAVTAGVTIR